MDEAMEAAVETQSIPNKTLPPMHPKPIQLELSWHSAGRFYKVTKIVNSTYYVPGEIIAPDRVTSICANPQWTVSMVDYDYFAAIAALVGGAVSVVANKGLL
jgi:hypothetical protein